MAARDKWQVHLIDVDFIAGEPVPAADDTRMKAPLVARSIALFILRTAF